MNFKIDPTLQVQNLTGIVIIPMVENPPVLIFKDFGAPFYLPPPKGYDMPLYDFRVHWQGNDYLHELPSEMDADQKEYIKGLSQLGKPTYLALNQSSYSILELPIEYLVESNGVVLKDKDLARSVMDYLVKLGLMQEQRGARRSEIEQQRDQFIIKEWEKSKREYPFPIEDIKRNWETYVQEELFPDDAEQAEAAYCHQNTIHNTLKRYIASVFYEEQFEIYLKDFHS